MKPGDRVRINQTARSFIDPLTPHKRVGRVGIITHTRTGTDFPYLVRFGDDEACWYKLSELDSVQERAKRIIEEENIPVGADTATRVRQVLTNVADLVEVRNRQYGDAALNPTPVLSDGNAAAGLRHRIDEKLARLRHQIDDTENPGDTLDDLIGSLALLRVCYQDTGLIL